MVCTMALWSALAFAEPVQAVAPQNDAGIRAGTLNVWGLPWPLAPGRKARLKRIRTWMDQSDLDVVALQEVWGRSRRHLVDEGLGGMTLVLPDTARDSGLAMATRHTVLQDQMVVFQARRGPDALKRKGAWFVTLELPGDQTLTVGTLHLQAGPSPKNAAVRRTQVQTVLREMPQGPMLLMGDFNLHRDHDADLQSHQTLVDGGLTEVTPGKKGRGTSRYGTHRLDRLYVRDLDALGWVAMPVGVSRDHVFSDHFPVQADFVRIESD
jgi:endonuclease/exonuclease/phosphatase family metal-dependent hydrolase